jgi:O-antigen ligase
MSLTPTQLSVPPKSRFRATTVAVLATVAFGTLFALTTASEFLADANTTTVILAALIFFALMVFAAAYGRASSQPAKWLVFVVWWGLLVSEEVFSYRSDIAGGGSFATGAYDQAVLWIVALLGLLIILLKYPQSLTGLFHGDYKWVTWITLVSIASCAYSPNPAFSFAWAFKLALVVLVVHICSQQISGMDDLRDFLKITVCGFFILVLAPTLRSIFEPDPLGTYGSGALEQRFREAPTAISGIAGLLAILCLMLYSPGKRRWPLWIGGIALIIMVVAGGKTGIIAGIFAGILFYGLQKRFKAVLIFAAVAAIMLTLALKYTPLADYMANYSELQAGATLTGRTDLWSFVTPYILEKPIIGYGFNASRFVAVAHPDTPFASPHMHNSLIEALYNNGIIGLFLILMVQFVIVRNLWRTIGVAATPELRYLAVGCLAAFVNLFINGMFNATFGGRPDASYMTLIALVVVSMRLVQLSKPGPAFAASESRSFAAYR